MRVYIVYSTTCMELFPSLWLLPKFSARAYFCTARHRRLPVRKVDTWSGQSNLLQLVRDGDEDIATEVGRGDVRSRGHPVCLIDKASKSGTAFGIFSHTQLFPCDYV